MHTTSRSATWESSGRTGHGWRRANRTAALPRPTTQGRRFRARFLCEHGCARVGIACRNWWSALTKYPHHPYGRPELYAERIALQAQQNTAETAFSSLQVGFKQALRGSGRNRIESMQTMEAMIWIALVTRSLLMLVDELAVATKGRRAA